MTKKEYKAAQEKTLLQIRRGYITLQEGSEKMLQTMRTLRDETNYLDDSGNYVDLMAEYHRLFLDLAQITRKG